MPGSSDTLFPWSRNYPLPFFALLSPTRRHSFSRLGNESDERVALTRRYKVAPSGDLSMFGGFTASCGAVLHKLYIWSGSGGGLRRGDPPPSPLLTRLLQRKAGCRTEGGGNLGWRLFDLFGTDVSPEGKRRQDGVYRPRWREACREESFG